MLHSSNRQVTIKNQGVLRCRVLTVPMLQGARAFFLQGAATESCKVPIVSLEGAGDWTLQGALALTCQSAGTNPAGCSILTLQGAPKTTAQSMPHPLRIGAQSRAPQGSAPSNATRFLVQSARTWPVACLERTPWVFDDSRIWLHGSWRRNCLSRSFQQPPMDPSRETSSFAIRFATRPLPLPGTLQKASAAGHRETSLDSSDTREHPSTRPATICWTGANAATLRPHWHRGSPTWPAPENGRQPT